MLELQAAVGIVVSLIVRGDYAAIEAMTRGRRLSGTELDHAVRSYGRRLRQPPPDWWERASVVPVDGSRPAVVMAAWPGLAGADHRVLRNTWAPPVVARGA